MGDSHEAAIAEWTGGSLQKASGSQWHRQGDTKNGEYLVPHPVTADGKSTLGKSISVTREMWKKIVDQTFNQIPMLFLRFYRENDESLRNADIDLAVIDAHVFAEILDHARKWKLIEDEMGEDRVKDVDHVIGLIRDGQEHRDKNFRELVQLGQEIIKGDSN